MQGVVTVCINKGMRAQRASDKGSLKRTQFLFGVRGADA